MLPVCLGCDDDVKTAQTAKGMLIVRQCLAETNQPGFLLTTTNVGNEQATVMAQLLVWTGALFTPFAPARRLADPTLGLSDTATMALLTAVLRYLGLLVTLFSYHYFPCELRPPKVVVI
jgi:hypothetical protein